MRVLVLHALDQEKYSVPQTELSGLTGTPHQKIDMIFKDVVHYVDQEDKRTDFLDRVHISLRSYLVCHHDVYCVPSSFCMGSAFYGWY